MIIGSNDDGTRIKINIKKNDFNPYHLLDKGFDLCYNMGVKSNQENIV